MNGSTTTTYWWRLDGLLGDEQGNGIDGWFAEPDTALSRHSPFEWEGFEFLEESVSNVDHLASSLHDLNQLDEAEKETFVPKASVSTSGPVKERLYSIIDTDKNDRLTLAEIRAALAKPWFAQPISQLVTKYESEWFYKAEKWDALDELMGHTAEQPNAGWVAEKKRIEHLSWWGNAAMGVEVIWHLHPIALIQNPKSRTCCELTLESFHNIFSSRALFSASNMSVTCSSYKVEHQKFIDILNAAFEKFEFSKCIHKMHFLAQCYHESDRFMTTKEYASGSSYDLSAFPASMCVLHGESDRRCKRHRQIVTSGNTTVGDGPAYKGKGLIQVT
jgi:hypothetical protein